LNLDSFAGIRVNGHPELLVRVDCCLSRVNRFKYAYPDAYFEEITREYNESMLSPSRGLLYAAKAGVLTFDEYLAALKEEIEKNKEACKRLDELAVMVKAGTVVFLVCVEKDATKCHRTLVRKMLLDRLEKKVKDS
jgi:uncharacterized protein YeaO (DUF488 family)